MERPLEVRIPGGSTPREALGRAVEQMTRRRQEVEADRARSRDAFQGLRALIGQPPRPAWGFDLATPPRGNAARPLQDSNAFVANTWLQGHQVTDFWRRQLTARPRQLPAPTPEVCAARDILRPFGIDDVAVSEPTFTSPHLAPNPEPVPEPLANRVAPATTQSLERYVLRQLGNPLAHVDEIDGEIKRRDPLAPKQWVDLWITAEVHRPPARDVRIRIPRPVFAAADLAVEDIYVLNTDRFPYLGAANPQPIEMPTELAITPAQRDAWERAYRQQREQAAQKSRERVAAEKKAEELLLSHLDDAQVKIWKVSRCFYVRSQRNHTYRVWGGFHGSVERLHAVTKEVTQRYCIVPSSGWWPTGDILVSKLMLLKYDEKAFLRLANRMTWLG